VHRHAGNGWRRRQQFRSERIVDLAEGQLSRPRKVGGDAGPSAEKRGGPARRSGAALPLGALRSSRREWRAIRQTQDGSRNDLGPPAIKVYG
jgi:hypothetical protein